MIDNLAYAGGGNTTYGDTHTLTFANATLSPPWDNVINNSIMTTARYVTTNNFTGSNRNDRQGNSIQNTTAAFSTAGLGGTQCTDSPTGSANMLSTCISYLYISCAALGLSSATIPTCYDVSNLSTNANNTSPNGTATITRTGVVGKPGAKGGESKGNTTGTVSGNPAGVNSATNGTICPAGWRLPVGQVGTSTNTYNEFAILNGAMYTVGQNLNPDITIQANYGSNWLPSGSFSAVGSGMFSPGGTGLNYQSTYGMYWNSSMVDGYSVASLMVVGSVSPGTNVAAIVSGLAVRCVFP